MPSPVLVALVVALAFVSVSSAGKNENTLTISGSTPVSINAADVIFRFRKSTLYNPGVDMKYHNGPVLTPEIRVHLIWYGRWQPAQQSIIRDFINSVGAASGVSASAEPSVKSWWSTVQLYTDQTGAHISGRLTIAGEHTDAGYSHGKTLTRMTTQEVIRSSLLPYNGTLPVEPRGGIYMVLTSDDVVQQDFCSAVCGFHYFTYASIVGYTLPYAWVGNSGRQCPDTCAYPFAVPFYMAESVKPLRPPNGDLGVDGMISVIGHELAEMSSNPLINAWFAGADPMAPTEIADLCEGMYGPGAGGGYAGQVSQDRTGASFNLHGVRGRRFLVQWLWSPKLQACHGPNSASN